MKSLNFNVISHENIDTSCMGKVGLHLNLKGTGRLAIIFVVFDAATLTITESRSDYIVD